MFDKLLQKMTGKKEEKYLPYEQDGKTYNLYDMPDGFVVKGDINLSSKNLKELPDLSKVIVKGSFHCSYNPLQSLKGAPQKVEVDFECDNCALTSLEGAPAEIKGWFDCNSNYLVTLEGGPQKVGGNFNCNGNKLTTLQGAPQVVGRHFDCSNNQLTTLEGAPQKIHSYFDCNHNRLTTLKGAPQEVEGYFNCENNDFTSLEGAPQKIGGDFACRWTETESLLGLPKMKDKFKVYFNGGIMDKYGFPEAFNGVEYQNLLDSSAYQSELAMYRISQKKNSGNSAEQKEQAQAKRKAGYAAFKKRMAKEEREE